MKNAGVIGRAQSLGDLQRDLQHFILRKSTPLCHQSFEAMSPQEFHHKVETTVSPSHGVNLNHVRVIDCRSQLRLLLKGRNANFIHAALLVENLDCNFTV